ncbi:MAG: 2-oxo acid dehydrogenase subunit E2 [Pseudomonadota bacterium]
MRAVVESFPAQRAHTYAFLRDAQQTAHVYLVADVDATKLIKAREAAEGQLSYISYVVKAAADVLASSEEAKTSLRDGFFPRLAKLPDVTAKVLFDKEFDGKRCVASGTIAAPDRASVAVIQSQIDNYKESPIAEKGPFAPLWKLRSLPLPLVRLIYNALLSNPLRRAKFQGTFSVTSVGHGHVRTVLPLIATTIGFGMGRIEEAPVVRDGTVTVAPCMSLSLTFDHRVLDGALAAELLSSIKRRLETLED